MLEWLGSHYAETVGTLALIVTTTNLTISIYRLRREARAGSLAPGLPRSDPRPEPDGVAPQQDEPGADTSQPIGAARASG